MEASIYSRENELRAIELFIKYDFGPKSVINELGYPCRASLCNWCNEYLADGNDIPDANPYQHYGEGLKRAVVDHYFKHGKCRQGPAGHSTWALPTSGISGMQRFCNCSNLVSDNGTTWASSKTSYTYMKINTVGTAGYLTAAQSGGRPQLTCRLDDFL